MSDDRVLVTRPLFDRTRNFLAHEHERSHPAHSRDPYPMAGLCPLCDLLRETDPDPARREPPAERSMAEVFDELHRDPVWIESTREERARHVDEVGTAQRRLDVGLEASTGPELDNGDSH